MTDQKKNKKSKKSKKSGKNKETEAVSKKSPAKNSAKKSSGKKAGKPSNGKTLRKEEQIQFSQLTVQKTSDSIFWIGSDASILFANDTACKVLGYTHKELLNKKVYEIDVNLTADMWEPMWQNAKKGDSKILESGHETKHGEIIDVEISSRFLVFNNSEYVIAYAHPIKDRKVAEDALEESESKFRLLSEQGLLALLIIQDNVIKYANNAMSDLTGYENNELMEMKRFGYAVMIHPEDQSFVVEQARKKQAGDKDVVSSYSFRLLTKKNELKWVDLYSKTVEFQGGKADFISLIDITERRKAEDLLQKSHDELEFLVKERTVELTEANRKLKRRIFDLYTIFELSRNFNAVLNYETLLDSFVLTSLGQMGVAKAALYLPAHAGGKNFQLTRVKGLPPFPDKSIAIKQDSEFGIYITAYNRPIFIDEISFRLPSEELKFTEYFEDGLIVPLIFQTKLRGVLVLSGKESGQKFKDEDIEFLSILANQTAVSIENARLYESEKSAVQKLQETQQLLLQNERLAVLGELSAKVAHEVNNPLGIIKNYLQLLQIKIGKANDTEKSNDYINIIRYEIDRIAGIVKQLLSMGRPMNINFELIDVTELIRETLDGMKSQFDSAKIVISLKNENEIPQIKAWADGLKQILLNLLMNAKYAIDQSGSIDIKIKALKHTVKISIEDTGPGIDEKHIPHIFEPFYSTKDDDMGSGLGLSVTSNIVKKHNGAVLFKNTKKGGCFLIELPIEQEESEYDWSI